MTPTQEKKTRVPCPTCGRMTSQLTRKVKGKYVGFERPDGTKLYSCGFCKSDEFTVPPTGEGLNRVAA